MRTIVFTENVHRDEKEELKNYLENNSWKSTDINPDELNAIISMINFVIGKRIGEQASGLSYLELLNLKNKIQS